MRRSSVWGIGLLVGLALAACSPTVDPSVSVATQRPNETPMPTLAAPAYRAPDTRITADNAAALQYLGRLEQDASAPSSIFASAISPDGTRLAALNNDLLITWDLLSGATLFTEERMGATNVYYSSDKTEIYTVAADGFVNVNSPLRGENLNSFNSGVAFNGVHAFSADDGWLALGGNDGSIQVWDTYARTSLATWSAHTAPLVALTFSADGSTLASVSDQGEIIVWDWRTRTALMTPQTRLQGVLALAFSVDGVLLTVATDSQLNTFNTTDGTLLYQLDAGIGSSSDVLRYSSDNRYLVTGGSDTTEMLVVNAQDGSAVVQLPQTTGIRTSAHFSPDGSLLVTTVLDGSVTLWNLAQATTDTIPSARLLVGSSRITSAEWSDDGFTLAFLDASGSVYIWGILGD